MKRCQQNKMTIKFVLFLETRGLENKLCSFNFRYAADILVSWDQIKFNSLDFCRNSYILQAYGGVIGVVRFIFVRKKNEGNNFFALEDLETKVVQVTTNLCFLSWFRFQNVSFLKHKQCDSVKAN